jgi:hypothetical protein
MPQRFEMAMAGVTIAAAGMMGGKLVPLLAQMSGAGTPDEWLRMILGPGGALVGTLIAIRWLVKRLDGAEEREGKKEQERAHREAEQAAQRVALLEKVIENGVATRQALEATNTLQARTVTTLDRIDRLIERRE